MEIKFTTNDYLLAWYLLFKPSFYPEIDDLKANIKKNYRDLVKTIQKDNIEILKYNEDFIPTDDTIYDTVFETDIFLKIKKEVREECHYLRDVWELNKKKIRDTFEDIIKYRIEDKFEIIVVHPKLNVTDFILNSSHNIAWGRKRSGEDIDTLSKILSAVLRYDIGKMPKEEVIATILELALLNEMETRILKTSTYNKGVSHNNYIKKRLYPYWLMYLGADQEEMLNYMLRDKIVFQTEEYPIIEKFKKYNLIEFIKYLIENNL